MTRVAIVATELMMATRIADAVDAAGGTVVRVDEPAALPAAGETDVAFVDWSARDATWGRMLGAWVASANPPPRLILYGPHTDLAAHAAARDAGIGPMLARSKLVSRLGDLVRDPAVVAGDDHER